jgi:pilus assembly protein Flp/PilA
MTKLGTLLRQRRDEGASAVEYGLLVALVAVLIAGTVWLLGDALRTQFQGATDCVASASSGQCEIPGGGSSEE